MPARFGLKPSKGAQQLLRCVACRLGTRHTPCQQQQPSMMLPVRNVPTCMLGLRDDVPSLQESGDPADAPDWLASALLWAVFDLSALTRGGCSQGKGSVGQHGCGFHMIGRPLPCL